MHKQCQKPYQQQCQKQCQKQRIEQLIQQLIDTQQQKLLRVARQINPHLTGDDVLQPHDFPELERHPEFRYEEGYLHALQSVQAAFRAISDVSSQL
jgi:hypothetical protein